MALDKEMQNQKLLLLGAMTQVSEEDQSAINELKEKLAALLREVPFDIAMAAYSLVGLELFEKD